MFTFLFSQLFVHFFRNVFYALLIHEYLYNKYPAEYENFWIDFAQITIRLYSNAQIKFNQLKRITNIKSNEIQNDSSSDTTVEYIIDGYVFHRENLSTHMITRGLDPFEYDFAIVTHCDGRKRIIKHMQDWDNSFEKSEVHFMLIEALFKDKRVKIDLKTEDYNYYLINNRIDDKFIYYFLKTVKQIDNDNFVKEDIKDVILSVLDHNVVAFDCQIEKDYIHITNTNYFRKSDIIAED